MLKVMKNLIKFTKKIFDKGFTELADVPFDKPLIMMKQLPALLKLKSYKSVYSLVSSYIKNEKLRRMLSMHPLANWRKSFYDNFYLWINFIP